MCERFMLNFYFCDVLVTHQERRRCNLGNKLPKALELAAPALDWTGFRGWQGSRSGVPLSKYASKDTPQCPCNWGAEQHPNTCHFKWGFWRQPSRSERGRFLMHGVSAPMWERCCWRCLLSVGNSSDTGLETRPDPQNTSASLESLGFMCPIFQPKRYLRF